MKQRTPEQMRERQVRGNIRFLGGLAVAFCGTATIYLGVLFSPEAHEPDNRVYRPDPQVEISTPDPDPSEEGLGLTAAGGLMVVTGAGLMIAGSIQGRPLDEVKVTHEFSDAPRSI